MRQNDQLFWIWLAEALGAGNSDFRILIDLYETPYDIFHADAAELERIGRLSERTVLSLSDKSLERAASIQESCERLGIGVMTYSSELYPSLLREIRNPPVLLYYAGTVPRLSDLLCIGMVGTRKMSAYGMETAYKISYELARCNAVVVSGMAAGIDGVCAAAALRANGTTVAVLGCGLDRVYPRHHGLLMNEIGKRGLLLSEYPPGTKPVYYHFPVRNRIISGLSHGIVVVEAGIGSGSLITAKEAVMQGRDVFAVPANADGVGTDGANGLLRDGAIFAAESSDILVRYQYLFASSLRTDLLRDAAKHSAADRAYLQSMGVLAVDPPAPVKAPAPVIPESPPAPEMLTDQEVPTVPSGAGVVTHQPFQPSECSSSRISDRPSGRPERKRTKVSRPEPKTSAPASKPIRASTPDEVLQSLSPVQLAVLKAIPDDRSASVDALSNLGYSCGEVITALTMLELAGLVQKLPGGLYTKA